MSKLLTNQISNYTDNGPVEVKDGINVASGKPLQVAGASGTSGQFLKSTGSSVAWETFPTIPAAQVNSDWNATSGVAEISNKPTLATVATSGSYNDLINKPTIPAAQLQSDWNQSSSSALDFIKNKPSIFSGAYADLTGKPTIPATLNDIADVNIASPVDNQYIKWDSGTNRWIQGTGSAGISNIVEDSSPQLGGTLDANSNNIDMGTNVVTDAKVGQWDTAYGWGNHASAGYLTSDANTTYSQEVAQATGNVKLRLVDSGGTQDDILITAGTNLSFSGVGSNGFTINSTASGGATVTTDDTAPGSPSDGDLWWKSDEGRLKVYYADGTSDQWVDASPPLTPTDLTAFTGNILPATNDQQDIGSASKKIRDLYLGSTSLHLGAVDISESSGKLVLPAVEMTGHFIPDTNAAYDLGNAEYKIRHLFLSDNTVYFQGNFLKVAQHDAGGSAQAASYLIPLSKLKDALNASGDYEAFKAAIIAIADA